MNIVRKFVELVYGVLATPIDGPEDVTEELLQRLVAFLSLVNSARTIQNKLSVIRRVLVLSGRAEFAKSSVLRSRNLGAPKGSRDGTNVAIKPRKFARLIRIADKLGEPGLVPVLKLQRTLGLRRQEAIMAGRLLRVWEQQLLLGLPVPVRDGTKNGRPRDVQVPDRDAALDAVREAVAVADVQGGVLFPADSLEAALTRYSFLMWKWVGMKGHALRYAFAKDLYFYFRDQGLTEGEAWPLVSDSMGHGQNREDLMRRVYLKNVIPRKTRVYKRNRK
jgi:hypothetical protein